MTCHHGYWYTRSSSRTSESPAWPWQHGARDPALVPPSFLPNNSILGGDPDEGRWVRI
jgi:hypothetical protein